MVLAAHQRTLLLEKLTVPSNQDCVMYISVLTYGNTLRGRARIRQQLSRLGFVQHEKHPRPPWGWLTFEYHASAAEDPTP